MGHSIISCAEIIDATPDLVEEETFGTEDKTTADASVLSVDNFAIFDMFQGVSNDCEEPNENDMAVDSGDEDGMAVDGCHKDSMAVDNDEEMEVKSIESTEQTVREEALSHAEFEVRGDKANYQLVMKYINTV